MRTSLANDRLIFDFLAKHESLRKMRAACDASLGHPIWWIAFRQNGGVKTAKQFADTSHEIWSDPRIRRYALAGRLLNELRARTRERHPFVINTGKKRSHYCVPLVCNDRVIGALGFSEFRKEARPEVLMLIADQAQTALESCARKEELERVSATIRPRAIALSTVHTVHRIINSTLNLDELISRLAHLTAQVLRANRCAIYLVEKPPAVPEKRTPLTPALVCRALVGYPKHKDKNVRIPLGIALEGKVAKTAQVVLRKKLICIPLIDEDVIGVITITGKKDKSGFTYFDQEILTTLAEEAVIAIKNAQLYEEQKKVTLGTIQSLAVILGTRVPTVASPDAFLRIVLSIAREMNMGEEDTQALHYATLLKDTAKIGIPENILKKPTKLTGEEYRSIREHPIKGAKIVQSFESLKSVVPIILYSREKFDGTGYPKGLRGDKIPLGARILAVINAFEAIIIGRPYRDRSTVKEAVAEIVKNKGTQFDPKVVDAFVKVIEKDDLRQFLKDAK